MCINLPLQSRCVIQPTRDGGGESDVGFFESKVVSSGTSLVPCHLEGSSHGINLDYNKRFNATTKLPTW